MATEGKDEDVITKQPTTPVKDIPPENDGGFYQVWS